MGSRAGKAAMLTVRRAVWATKMTMVLRLTKRITTGDLKKITKTEATSMTTTNCDVPCCLLDASTMKSQCAAAAVRREHGFDAAAVRSRAMQRWAWFDSRSKER